MSQYTYIFFLSSSALGTQQSVKGTMFVWSASLVASNDMKLWNKFAASSASVGRLHLINHTQEDLLSINNVYVSMFLCLWTPTHSVTFGRAHLEAQRG